MSPSSSPSGWCAGSYAGSATSAPLRRRRSPRSATTTWPGCTSSQRGRHRPGEGLGVAVVKGQAPGEGAPPPHGAGPADGHGEPFLLLHLGPRVGSGVLEDQRIWPFPGLALVERPLLGTAPAGQGRYRLPGPRQRLPVL